MAPPKAEAVEEWTLSRVGQLCVLVLMEMALMPLQLLGMALYTAKVWFLTIPRGISGTANEPFFARLLMHWAGTRQDSAAARLAPHLPALGLLMLRLIATYTWPCHVSGFMMSFFAFPPSKPSNMASFVSHRCEFFDRELEAAVQPLGGTGGAPGVRQVVILGAGWDTRAWESLSECPVRIFEVDAPATSRAKQQAVTDAHLTAKRRDVAFVECDFETTAWLDALEGHGFVPGLKTFVLWEGVSCYLPEEAVRGTLSSVARLAPGSSIAFDFYADEFINFRPPFRMLGLCAVGAAGWFYKERFQWGITAFPGPVADKLRHFLSEEGLRLEKLELFGTEERPFGGLALACT